jgi:hypothetical protein
MILTGILDSAVGLWQQVVCAPIPLRKGGEQISY